MNTTGPLASVRVLDLTEGIAAPFATKMLADLGADVIKVEFGDGDPARLLGPFPGDVPDPETSLLFAYLNTNKRGIRLDPASYDDRNALRRLALGSDMVIESLAPGMIAELGIAFESLRSERPDLAVVSITPFGQTGPYRDWRASELVLYAMGAEMHSVGLEDRPPLKTGGTSSLFQAGAMAATGALGALLSARRHGIGQWVDVSIMETHLANVDRRPSALLAYQFTGKTARRNPESGEGYPTGVYPCADGYVQISSSVPMWNRVVDMIGDPALRDPKWTAPTAQNDPELLAEFNAIFYAWLFDRTKAKVWDEANRVRLPCAPLNTWEDLHSDPVLEERGFWADVPHPVIGTVRMPGRPSVWSRTPWAIRRPAPRLGEHTDEVLAEGAPRAAPATTPGKPLPLAGIRVLDFGVAWAGPFCGQLLADLGAEVIKVENIHVWQLATRGHMAHPTKEFLAGLAPIWGGYPGGEPGAKPWNRSPMGVNTFRNKRSMTIDLRQPRGLELFAKLISEVDVVCENNATGTMEKLGITYGWLKSINPRVVYVRMPGFGSTGARAEVRSVGSSIEAYVGHTLMRGYPDLDVSHVPVIFPSDGFCGINGALAALAALAERERSGEGQEVSVAQAEAGLTMFPEAALDWAVNGRISGTFGNRDAHGAAPSGVYPCRGDDRWIAITIEDDRDWRAVCTAMGRADLGADPRISSREGRMAAHDELDTAISAWTAGQDYRDLAARLQAVGVAAGPVLDARSAYEDPHLAARGHFQRLYHEDTGAHDWPGMPWRFSETPLSIRIPPCDLGEANDYVYRELLGVTDDEFGALEREGHIGSEFDADIP